MQYKEKEIVARVYLASQIKWKLTAMFMLSCDYDPKSQLYNRGKSRNKIGIIQILYQAKYWLSWNCYPVTHAIMLGVGFYVCQ